MLRRSSSNAGAAASSSQSLMDDEDDYNRPQPQQRSGINSSSSTNSYRPPAAAPGAPLSGLKRGPGDSDGDHMTHSLTGSPVASAVIDSDMYDCDDASCSTARAGGSLAVHSSSLEAMPPGLERGRGDTDGGTAAGKRPPAAAVDPFARLVATAKARRDEALTAVRSSSEPASLQQPQQQQHSGRLLSSPDFHSLSSSAGGSRPAKSRAASQTSNSSSIGIGGLASSGSFCDPLASTLTPSPRGVAVGYHRVPSGSLATTPLAAHDSPLLAAGSTLSAASSAYALHRIAEWVHAPLDCEYHTEVKRRLDGGQLLASPYEVLLRQCLQAITDQHFSFAGKAGATTMEQQLQQNKKRTRSKASSSSLTPSSPAPQSSSSGANTDPSTARLLALYAQWRAHRETGEDIALAFNPDGADPYLALVNHRASMEWRLEALADITALMQNTFAAEQANYRAMVVVRAAGSGGGTAQAGSGGYSSPTTGGRLQSLESSLGEGSFVLVAAAAASFGASGGGAGMSSGNFVTASSPAHLHLGASSPAPSASPSPRSGSRHAAAPALTVAARRTVTFWLRQMNLSQLFEDLFADTLSLLEQLPIFFPESYVDHYYQKKRKRGAGMGGGGGLSPAGAGPLSEPIPVRNALYHEYIRSQARGRFLREAPKLVWAGVKAHVAELTDALLAVWRTHEALRAQLKLFDGANRRASVAMNSTDNSNKGRSASATSAAGPPSVKGVKRPSLGRELEERRRRKERERATAKLAHSILETLELAGAADYKAFLLSSLRSGSDNAAAATATLDVLAEDVERVERRQRRRLGVANSGDDHNDDEDEEEELLTAQNLSPTEQLDGEEGLRAPGGGSTLRATRIKLVVSSPMVVVGGVSHFSSANSVTNASAPSVSASGAEAAREAAGAAARTRRTKHVTFVLEPTIIYAERDDDSASSPRGGGYYSRSNHLSNFCSRLRATRRSTAAGGGGGDSGAESPDATAALSRQGEFTWKRYNDQKNEVPDLFYRHTRLSDSGSGSGDGSPNNNSTSTTASLVDEADLAAVLAQVRYHRQKLLLLFFKLEEEEGVRRMAGGRAGLERVRQFLAAQLDLGGRYILDLKAGDFTTTAGTTSSPGGDGGVSAGSANNSSGGGLVGASPLLLAQAGRGSNTQVYTSPLLSPDDGGRRSLRQLRAETDYLNSSHAGGRQFSSTSSFGTVGTAEAAAGPKRGKKVKGASGLGSSSSKSKSPCPPM